MREISKRNRRTNIRNSNSTMAGRVGGAESGGCAATASATAVTATATATVQPPSVRRAQSRELQQSAHRSLWPAVLCQPLICTHHQQQHKRTTHDTLRCTSLHLLVRLQSIHLTTSAGRGPPLDDRRRSVLHLTHGQQRALDRRSSIMRRRPVQWESTASSAQLCQLGCALTLPVDALWLCCPHSFFTALSQAY